MKRNVNIITENECISCFDKNLKELELLKKLCGSENVSIEKEGKLLRKLYKHRNYNIDDIDNYLDVLENDIEHNFIAYHTITSNKMQYFWYLDERHSVAIDINGNIYDDDDNNELEGILY